MPELALFYSFENLDKQVFDATPFILTSPFSLSTPETTESYIATQPYLTLPVPYTLKRSSQNDLPLFLGFIIKLKFVHNYLEKILYTVKCLVFIISISDQQTKLRI